MESTLKIENEQTTRKSIKCEIVFFTVLLLSSCSSLVEKPPNITGVVIAKEGSSFLVFEGVSNSDVTDVLNEPELALQSIDFESVIWIHANKKNYSEEIDINIIKPTTSE